MNIIRNSSIVVQWDEVNDFLPTTYLVTWTDDRDLHGVATVEEQTSYTIIGLTLHTVYTITVYSANRCGDGPPYITSVSLSTDTTSTTSTISSTVTASTNPMSITSTANPISTTAAVTSYSITTTISVTTVINSSTDIPIAITYPSITTITDIVDPPIPTNTSETCKFSTST